MAFTNALACQVLSLSRAKFESLHTSLFERSPLLSLQIGRPFP